MKGYLSVSYKSAALLCLSIALASCGGKLASETPPDFSTPIPNRVEAHQDSGADSHTQLDSSQAAAELQVVLVPSELVIGSNRFAVGLFDPSGHMYLDAKVHLRYFDLSSPNAPVLESEADAERLATPDNSTAIFAHEREFGRAGDWGVEVQARFPDGAVATKGVAFQVVADSNTITPGKKVPNIKTPTAADAEGNLTLLTSATTPNPAFYKLSLDKAIANGKPTVLLFSTPAFCESRLCGPAYEVLTQVQKDYGDAANFIHVEVYTGLPDPAATGWRVAPAMQAFGLSTEPWVFFIDNTGTVVYRIEGLVTVDETERHLKSLLGR